MSTFYAVVTRKVRGLSDPVISTVIPQPVDFKESEALKAGDYDFPDDLEKHFRAEAVKHKEFFCSQFVEFKWARWEMTIVQVHPEEARKVPIHFPPLLV